MMNLAACHLGNPTLRDSARKMTCLTTGEGGVLMVIGERLFLDIYIYTYYTYMHIIHIYILYTCIYIYIHITVYIYIYIPKVYVTKTMTQFGSGGVNDRTYPVISRPRGIHV